MNCRMDRTKLNLGAYYLEEYARSEEHIRDLRDSGLDFIVGMDYDKEALDLFAKYGIGAIVRRALPLWWGGDGSRAGTMAEVNPIEAYVADAEKFVDHPAVWAIDTGDEPSALDFDHYRTIMNTLSGIFARQFLYLNLYPNYAAAAKNDDEDRLNQLGTENYAEYIEEACRKIPLDYICYDHYVYATKNISQCMENFRIVSDAARRYGRSFWYIPQLNSNVPEEWQSVERMRFQAFSALAFGAEVITWACYTKGWWYNQVLDGEGKKTAQYEKMKTVNRELKGLGEQYMKYRNTATHFVGVTGDSDFMSEINQAPEESFSNGYFINLRADDEGALLVGEMTARVNNDKKALFVVAAEDWRGENIKERNIVFGCDARCVLATGKDGKLPIDYNPETKEYSVKIKSCEAVLIEAK